MWQELKAEWEFMKRIVKKVKSKVKQVYKKKIIKRKENIMSDSDFQTGMTAAINAYYASLNGGYVVTGLSYTYTPPVTATPPAETVQVF